MPQGNAKLATIVAELRAMDNRKVTGILESELAKAVRPLAPQVRARILNIPTHGTKHTGLRARIARCVEVWAKINGPVAQVGIEMNSSRMPSGQKGLPIKMEGVKRFTHPVYGTPDKTREDWKWVIQQCHPYFYAAAGELGPASAKAVDRALEQITRQISG